jgi:hypothetical protein
VRTKAIVSVFKYSTENDVYVCPRVHFRHCFVFKIANLVTDTLNGGLEGNKSAFLIFFYEIKVQNVPLSQI